MSPSSRDYEGDVNTVQCFGMPLTQLSQRGSLPVLGGFSLGFILELFVEFRLCYT